MTMILLKVGRRDGRGRGLAVEPVSSGAARDQRLARHLPHAIRTSRRASSRRCSKRTASRSSRRSRAHAVDLPGRRRTACGEVRIAVPPDEADGARAASSRAIARTSDGARRVRCATSSSALERAHRLPLPRPRPARARADAQVARARGRERRRRRQRVARVPRRRGARASSSPTCCSASSRTSTKGRSRRSRRARLDGVAGAAGRAARARRPPAARPRRGEDRRPPQAGAARRHLRGADRGDLSRRRPRGGAHVHPRASCATTIDAACARRTSSRDFKSALQERLQARGRPLPDYRVAGASRARSRQAVSRRSARRRRGAGARRAGRTKKEAEQEAARLALRSWRELTRVARQASCAR